MSNANPHADMTTNSHGGTESTRSLADGGPQWEFCDVPHPDHEATVCDCPKGHAGDSHWQGATSWPRE